ncbi:hypothetical protein PHLCEN_2v13445 [Hermanssonia centrifuga]|uniref:Uncharacterized protein n=1 Tax=Hermanssonia centrifuga TaxID=98765 RepID=A0A2R6NF86_9APHY|nr:hypothetical protein PHLCEN_2v13445 [Hermanssonia centrifuga]
MFASEKRVCRRHAGPRSSSHTSRNKDKTSDQREPQSTLKGNDEWAEARAVHQVWVARGLILRSVSNDFDSWSKFSAPVHQHPASAASSSESRRPAGVFVPDSGYEAVRWFLDSSNPSMECLTDLFVGSGIQDEICLVGLAALPQTEQEAFLRFDLSLNLFQTVVILNALKQIWKTWSKSSLIDFHKAFKRRLSELSQWNAQFNIPVDA